MRGGGWEITTAVEGLDLRTRIADMTPWLWEHSLGAHVSLALRPRLHANPACPCTRASIRGWGRRDSAD